MSIRKLFYFLLAICYFGIGLFVWIRQIVPEPWNVIFGIACLLIASLRFYRGFKMES